MQNLEGGKPELCNGERERVCSHLYKSSVVAGEANDANKSVVSVVVSNAICNSSLI